MPASRADTCNSWLTVLAGKDLPCLIDQSCNPLMLTESIKKLKMQLPVVLPVGMLCMCLILHAAAARLHRIEKLHGLSRTAVQVIKLT